MSHACFKSVSNFFGTEIENKLGGVRRDESGGVMYVW